MTLFRQIVEDFLHLLYPAYCLACLRDLENFENLICLHCHHDLPKMDAHLDPKNTVAQKFWGKVELQYALAYLKFQKKGRVQRLLHQLKYKNKPEIAEILGRWYGTALKDAGFTPHFDLILPIPLHKKRFKQRGYNQSDGFAKGLSEAMDIPWAADLLQRNKATKSQTRKARYARWQNVENIFEATNPSQLQGKHILLVDDVITTGSTLEACAQILLKHTSKISVATIAAAE